MKSDLVLTILFSVITLMFFISGIKKVLDYGNVVNGLQELTFPDLPKIIFQIAIVLVIILEIVAPVLIVLGSFNPKLNIYAYYSALALFVFTLLATIVYHFPPKGAKYYPFISNITTSGALLLIAYNLNQIKK